MRVNVPLMNVMRIARPCIVFSCVLSLLSLAIILMNGLNMGLEFTGGSTIEVQYPQAVETTHVREIVKKVHPDANVVQYGSSRDVQIKYAEITGEDTGLTTENIIAALKEDNPLMTVQSQSKVGGQYKEELLEKGTLAFIFSCLGILIYLAIRFEKKFAIAAVISQIHDVLITLGIFSLFQWTFDLTVLAAFLAILGYSVNDTVVVFDRIRENFIKLPSKNTREIINVSVCQTLARTIVTSLTTLFAVIALLVFGGQTLQGFSIAMCIGIIFGTYSSIFIAASLVLYLGVTQEDMLPKEREAIDDLP